MKEYKVVVDDEGTRRWYNQEGNIHREDGPAVEWTDGSNWWYINGNVHREDGPAIEDVNGEKIWYINGQELTEEEFNNRNNKELTVNEIEQLLGYKIKVVGNDQYS